MDDPEPQNTLTNKLSQFADSNAVTQMTLMSLITHLVDSETIDPKGLAIVMREAADSMRSKGMNQAADDLERGASEVQYLQPNPR